PGFRCVVSILGRLDESLGPWSPLPGCQALQGFPSSAGLPVRTMKGLKNAGRGGESSMAWLGHNGAALVVGLGVGATSLGAQSRLTPLDSANRWVDSVFAPYGTSSPGCAVGVVRDGKLAFAKGYGMADLEHDTPITPSTRFYISSLSKQFTAMSIVLLAQDGRLSLDDWIRRWGPQVPACGPPVPLRPARHHPPGP